MKGTIEVGRAYFETRFLRRFSDRVQLEAWQHRMVVNHLKAVLPKSPYYRSICQSIPPERWMDLPIMDRLSMIESFGVTNTVGISRDHAYACAESVEKTGESSHDLGGVTAGLSSGTSGERGLFLASDSERLQWAGVVLAKTLTLSLRRQKIALFLRANSDLYGTLGKGRAPVSYFDLKLPLASHLARLESTNPHVLVAPPSILSALARLRKGGRLAVRPEQIVSCAEVLEPDAQETIEETFSLRLRQIYQATEGFLGCTCPFGTMHLNEDYLVIQREYLDEKRFLPIITDFTRITQPIIRYRLDDILIDKPSPCPCGSVLRAIEGIEGRYSDVFFLPRLSANTVVRVFSNMIRNAFPMKPDCGLANYKVIQRDLTEWEVRFDVTGNVGVASVMRAQFVSSLEKLCAMLDARMPCLDFTDWVQNPGFEKFRRFEQIMPPEKCRDLSYQL